MANLPADHMFPSPHSNGDLTRSPLQDSAFEPHSGFMFDDGDDQEFHNMQRNLAALQGFNDHHSQHAFNAMGEMNHDMMHGHSDFHAQMDPDFNSPFAFGQDSMSNAQWYGSKQEGRQPPSIQAEIVSGRSNQVSQQFGQITPPNDTTPEDAPSQATPPAEAKLSAKSERARNAANHRHAKAKKARKDSVRKVESPETDGDDDDDDVEDKRERYREKNRLAAAKCRAKKKMNTEDLEQSARDITARNNKLRAEERELRDLFSSLRDQALAHDPTQGCNCQAIHSYNMNKAQEAVKGAAMGACNHAVPSPPLRSPDSAMSASRTQSFSTARPALNKHQMQSQFLDSQMGFYSSNGATEFMRQQSASIDGDGLPEY